MIVNKSKHQALILGDTEHTFSFPVKESIDIFGMTIDNKLQFDKHVSFICKKVNSQLNVMIRFRKLISKSALILLYKSLFLTKYPIYMRNMFTLRSTSYNLRGNYILTLPIPRTTTYDLRSFSYYAANQWNSLPDFFRTANFNDFKKALASFDCRYIS